MTDIPDSPPTQKTPHVRDDVVQQAGVLLALLQKAIKAKNVASIQSIIEHRHTADIGAALSSLSEDDARFVFETVGSDLDPEVFTELDDDVLALAFEVVPQASMAEALEDLDTDDAAELVADLEDEQRQNVLANASDETRIAIEGALSFEEETAGRLMQREFVAAPAYWDVGRTIDHMRDTGEDLPDLFYEIYMVDPAMHPVGAVAVSRLMRAPRTTSLEELMEPLPIIVRPEQDQEEVAMAFQRYHLISAPVVDGDGRLSGMLTVDDMVQVIQSENEEDLLALAGVRDGMRSGSMWESVTSRLPWLSLNLITALMVSLLISRFEGEIDKIVALAVLMPIVASLGGNAATQTLAVSVRTIAAGDLPQSQTAALVGRELATAMFNGLVLASILAVVAGLWYHSVPLGLTIGAAVLMNFTVAGLVGILVPLGLKAMGQDPAVSSGVFVTFATDLVGFTGFLTLAGLMLIAKHG